MTQILDRKAWPTRLGASKALGLSWLLSFCSKSFPFSRNAVAKRSRAQPRGSTKMAFWFSSPTTWGSLFLSSSSDFPSSRSRSRSSLTSFLSSSFSTFSSLSFLCWLSRLRFNSEVLFSKAWQREVRSKSFQTGHKSAINNHQSSINNQQSSIINYKYIIINHQSSIINLSLSTSICCNSVELVRCNANFTSEGGEDMPAWCKLRNFPSHTKTSNICKHLSCTKKNQTWPPSLQGSGTASRVTAK